MKIQNFLQSVGVYLVILFVAISASPAADETTERDLTRVKLTVEDEPWLRINAGGHTATVQALAFTPDSERLCSAGLDKDVLVWNLSTLRDIKRTFLRERTIRWQVARGLRGSIYALASAPKDGLLAIGGYGAMGSLGEIILVDPIKGTLVKVLEGHRQSVCSLAFSPDGKRLVSADTSGRVLLWNREGGNPTVIREADEKTYDKLTVGYINSQPKMRPVAFLGNDRVIVPVMETLDAFNVPRWKLMEINANDSTNTRKFEAVHYAVVTALATTADGMRLASTDMAGSIFCWEKVNDKFIQKTLKEVHSGKEASPCLSLAYSPDGFVLLVGTAIDAKKGGSQLQIWDVAEKKIVAERDLIDHVHTCTFSPDGKRFAYVGGKNNEVFVERFTDLKAVQKANLADQSEKPATLRGTGQKIFKVAFAANKPFYRVAFGTEFHDKGFNDSADLGETFDTAKLALGPEQKLKPADWLPNEWLAGGWTAKPQADGTIKLYFNNVPKGTVELAPQLPHFDEGHIRCYCWIPDKNGKPFAIAVGTDRQNSIYVCKLAEKGPCPILRHFRGHNDYITSLCVSRDLQYLVSGSADGTIRFWSLAEMAKGTEMNRWGAEFTVWNEGQDLLAEKVNPAGPLYQKGVRYGDVINSIRWPADGNEKGVSDCEKMTTALRDMPWGTQVVFDPARYGKNTLENRPAFQLLPAWPPLATLFVSTKREWAFWTPAGYYDASMNGYRLFGWQVNRGLQKMPDFYRADQFFKKLERPDVMEKLLMAGSLQGAFKLAASAPPAQLNDSLPEQIAATPRVEILSPEPGSTIKDVSTRVRAKIEMPADRKILQAKVFANGVVGKDQKIVGQRALESGTELTYEWDVALPQDQKNLIQVMVGTDAPTAAFGDVLVDRTATPETQPPKLYIVAMGVNKYGDPEIQPLTFSIADAEAVVAALRDRSKGLYTLDDVELLTNKQVTPEDFRKAIEKLGEKLKNTAKPNDVLLLFLAGHGIVDEQTKKYYFIGHDFTMVDFRKGNYKDCISWDDFRGLTDVPCRKLALLDTCHSGAIQPPRSRDLKVAVRQMQDDVIFTVTASTGDQRSAEKQSWGHGAFTKCLLEALDGKAAAQKGYVTLDELVTYLKQSVPELTEGLQTPTAAPDDILPYTSLPLVNIKNWENR